MEENEHNLAKEVSSELTVQNKMGIHARPSAMIVRIANKYENCNLFISKDGEQINGKSIMGLMMLAAGRGSVLKITVTGEGGQSLIDELDELFKNKFDEE